MPVLFTGAKAETKYQLAHLCPHPSQTGRVTKNRDKIQTPGQFRSDFFLLTKANYNRYYSLWAALFDSLDLF